MRDTLAVTATSKSVEYTVYYRKDLKPLIWFVQRLGAFSLSEAEDVAQEAMKSLWKNWEKVENPDAYTRRAARWVLYRMHGKAKRMREVAVTTYRADPNDVHLDEDPFDTDVRGVLAMLQALPKAQREVFALHMDDWDTEAIAQITEQKPATVRSNLRHARENLKRMIKKKTDEATRKEANDGP